MSVTLTSTHPRAQCVDLRATFGRRFRYAWDASYAAERSDFRAVEAPWLTVIPCRFGRIVPWGGRRLAAYCRAGAMKRRELEALPGMTIVQGGGPGCREVVVTFDVDLIDQVAAVLQAKRPRPPLSARQLAVLAAGRRPPFPARAAVENVSSRAPDSTIGLSDEETHAGGQNEAGA
jgi:hypothetical protein